MITSIWETYIDRMLEAEELAQAAVQIYGFTRDRIAIEFSTNPSEWINTTQETIVVCQIETVPGIFPMLISISVSTRNLPHKPEQEVETVEQLCEILHCKAITKAPNAANPYQELEISGIGKRRGVLVFDNIGVSRLGTHLITLINGDGIGQEVIPAARALLESLELPLSFQEAEAGFGAFEKYGNALPDETLKLCDESAWILFGATQSPMQKVAGYASPILTLRQHFELYANLRPAKSPPTLNPSPISEGGTAIPLPSAVGEGARGWGSIDMLIVRENTEGLYSRRERVENDGLTAIAERVITANASERIVRTACLHALGRRKKLTIVHKANVLKETCGLFRRIAFEVTAKYPDLEVEEMLVDTAAMRMVQNPERFDVIVTTNLFGDILSDLAAGLTGGLGIAPSANVGDKWGGVYEPVHGSAPDIAGKGIADPRAAILSAAMLLADLGYRDHAGRLREITYATPHTGNTRQTAENIIQQLESVVI